MNGELLRVCYKKGHLLRLLSVDSSGHSIQLIQTDYYVFGGTQKFAFTARKQHYFS